MNPYRHAILTTIGRAGLRLDEALALQWEDLHFGPGEIRVARGIWRDRLDTLKSRHDRTVDISQQLARSCASDRTEDGDVAPRVGCAPSWAFQTKRGTPLDTTNA